MSKQLHNNFVDEQVKLLLKSYVDKEIKINYILSTKPKRKVHEREVITHYPGEMFQHDSSHHQFSKYANKWYLITSLDNYSRLILYACLVERETTWINIIALKVVILRHGMKLTRNGNRFWTTVG